MSAGPIPGSYWVVESRLLAGPYPGDYDDAVSRQLLQALLGAGIRAFIDLTEEGEWPDYKGLLERMARMRGVEVQHTRAAIHDMGVPDDEELAETLGTIEQCLEEDRPVYVHCLGGLGRTGTIIGCWLAQHGHEGDVALQQLKELRKACSYASSRSPQTEEQCEVVRAWRRR
jgi:protein-tyrosine phosphatase